MKRPYTPESWEKFVELMRKTIRKITSISTKMDTFEADTTKKVDDAIKDANKKVDDKLAEINDYTTGINLIRYSSNFRFGSERFADSDSATIYKDGWNSNRVDLNSDRVNFEIDENRITKATLGNGETDGAYTQLFSSVITVKDNVRQYTLSCKVKAADKSIVQEKNCMAVSCRDESFGFIKSIPIFYPKDSSDDQFQSIVHQFEVPLDCKYMYVVLQVVGKSTITFTMPSLVEGYINNPIWSPAPADLALEPINDVTTGINLLRGTRDFSIGTTRLGKIADVYTDGLSTYSQFQLSKDELGFTVLSVRRDEAVPNKDVWVCQPSVIYGQLKPGDEYTVFFDIRFNDIELLNAEPVFAVFERKFDLENGDKDVIISHNVTIASQGLSKDNIENNKWYHFVGNYIMSDEANGLTISIRLPGAGDYSIKKVGLYKGNVENPEWSASPFDVATTAELYENTRYTLEDLFTPDDNFTITSRVLRVNGRMAQIYIYATTKDALQINTKYTIGTLDTKIRPSLHAGIVGYSSNDVCVTGMIASDTGTFRINVTGDIPANQRISMCSMYILANVESPTATLELPGGEILVGQVPSLEESEHDISTMPLPDDMEVVFQTPDPDNLDL